jgi:spore coat protein CotH
VRRALIGLAVVLVACGGGGSGAGDDDDAPGDDGDGDDGDDDELPPDESDAVFAPDVLHEVAIEVAEADLASLDDVNERVPCRVSFDGVVVEDAGVRNKGQTSLRGVDDKLSFSLKFDQFVAGQRLHGLKKLILSNTVQDPSFSNEPVTYLVYQRAGLPAPRTAHAIVSLNGEVKGLYVVVESVDKQFLERHYGDGNGDGNLYEGPWDFPKGADLAELKDEVEEMRSRADLEALTDVVMDSPDVDFTADVEALVDLDQFILDAAIEAVTNAWDGYLWVAWNFYLYHRPDTGRFVFLPHGANWPYWVADMDPFDLAQDPWGTGDPPGRLAVRVTEIPALEQRYRDAIADVTATAFDVDAIGARLDQIEAVLHSTTSDAAAVAADLASFDDSIGELRDFVVARKAYLQAL